MIDRAPRGAPVWHCTVAGLVVLALLLQVWIAVRVPGTPPGHEVGTLRGTGLPWRVARVFSFFTIQSNVLTAIASATLALDPRRDGRGWRVLRLDSLFGITLTGVVYSAALADVHEPQGWQETSTNAVVHYVAPVMAVVGWLVWGPRPRITGQVVLLSLLWPFGYLGYALVVGALTRWYPYPFLDVASHGYGRVLVNACGVVLVFAAIASLFWWGDRRLGPAPGSRRSPSTTGCGPAR